MDKIKLMAFSLDLDALQEYIEEIRSLCTTKSIEYKGPIAFPVFKFRGPLDGLATGERMDVAPDWVHSIEFGERELSRLRSYERPEEASELALMGRLVVAITGTAAQDLLVIPIPDPVCVQVVTDPIEASSTGNQGPYTYDPGRDHATDIDFKAHRS